MEKARLLFSVIVMIASYTLSAQVAINSDGSSADVSAMLDIKSDTAGILIPRMTETERSLISTPADGLLVYQTDADKGFYYHNGSSWTRIGDSWMASGNDIYNTNTGSVGIGTSSPNTSSLLDLESTTKGFLPPRMTTAERDEISNPSEGLVIYTTDYKILQVFDGTIWSSPNAGYACGYQILDVDSNIYNTILIGAQCWMVENLATTKYNNGVDIPLVTDPVAWEDLYTPGYCWYNNDSATYGVTYGALYNWYTVDTGHLCPSGWHVPDDGEWKIMEMHLGMSQAHADANGWRGTDEGGKLKETGTTYWDSPNTGATNESGFSALPGGHRRGNGDFNYLGTDGYWWSATEYIFPQPDEVWCRNLSYDNDKAYRYWFVKEAGHSVRCLRD